MAYSLLLIGKRVEAINILFQYSNTEYRILWDLISFLSYCGEWDKIKEVIETLINKNEVFIPERLVYIFINLVLFFPEMFYKYVSQLKLEDELNNIYFKELIELFNGNRDKIESLLEKENTAPDLFKTYYPFIYERKGDLDKALLLTKQLIPSKGINGFTFLNIDLLEKMNKGKELLEALENLRNNGINNPSYLLKEFNIAIKIHDHKRAALICDKLREIDPNDITIIFNTIISYHLANKKLDQQSILINKLKESAIPIEYTISISKLLIQQSNFDEALDFLYSQIILTNSQKLRDFYFQIHIVPEIEEIMDKEKEIAEEGDYICYDDGEKEDFIILRKDELLANFIGTKVDYCFKLNQGVKTLNFRLKSIHNKYFALLNEIISEIHNNRSQDIRSFSYDDIKENPLDGLNKILEAFRGIDSKTYNDQIKKDIDNYINGEVPLCIIKGNKEIKGLYELLFSEFHIIQISSYNIKRRYQNIDFKSHNIILDLSSLILIHAISKKFEFKFDIKFIISQRCYDFIKDSFQSLKYAADNIILNNIIIENLSQFKESDNSPLSLYHILRDLLIWIDDNCKVEIVEEMAFSNGKDFFPIIEVLLENIFLAQRSNTLLVSEEIWIYKYNNIKAINSEYLLTSILSVENSISPYLIQLNFWGANYTGNFIITEILKSEKEEINEFEKCINLVKYNPFQLLSILQESFILERGIITPKRFINFERIIFTIFESLGPQRTLHVYNQIKKYSLPPIVKETIDIAFNKIQTKNIFLPPSCLI